MKKHGVVQLDRVLQCRACGWSLKDIGDLFGVTESAISVALKRADLRDGRKFPGKGKTLGRPKGRLNEKTYLKLMSRDPDLWLKRLSKLL
jgi:hypothetical protein